MNLSYSKANVVEVRSGDLCEMLVTTREVSYQPGETYTQGWLPSELRIDGMPDGRARGHRILRARIKEFVHFFDSGLIPCPTLDGKEKN